VVNPGKPCQDLALGEDTGVIEPEFIEAWQVAARLPRKSGGETRDQRDVFLCRDLCKSYRVDRLRKAETNVAGFISARRSKRFFIAHNSGRQGHTRYTALRDVIGREFRNVARKTKHMLRSRQVLQGDRLEEFWALKNVSFEVKEGWCSA
jgi:hypothetical protein